VNRDGEDREATSEDDEYVDIVATGFVDAANKI
jgi:hypothetical protein